MIVDNAVFDQYRIARFTLPLIRSLTLLFKAVQRGLMASFIGLPDLTRIEPDYLVVTDPYPILRVKAKRYENPLHISAGRKFGRLLFTVLRLAAIVESGKYPT
jgi:hypothetical protein